MEVDWHERSEEIDQDTTERANRNSTSGRTQQTSEIPRPNKAFSTGEKKELMFLNIVYFNARSIFNKLDELQLFLYDKDPDLVIITETWLNDQISNAMLSIQGYEIENDLRHDREDTVNGIGGGIIIYRLCY